MIENRFGKFLKLDEASFANILDKKKKTNRKPVILTFMTPGLWFFDIYRILKLAQFSKAGFEIIILINRGSERIINKQFRDTIERLIPKNKRIVSYGEILDRLEQDPKYREFTNSIKLKIVYDILKDSREPRNLSLLNLNHFAAQYYLLTHSEYLDVEPDFMLTTKYKEDFFEKLPGFSPEKLPLIISLPSFYVPWKFSENLSKLERMYATHKINKTQVKIINKDFINVFREITENNEKKDIISSLNDIKQYIYSEERIKEHVVSKEEVGLIIFALNNNLRKRMLNFILKNEEVRAEEIRKALSTSQRNYSLPSVIKNLNILIKAGIVLKKDRKYNLKTNKLILNLPMRWFSKYQSPS